LPVADGTSNDASANARPNFPIDFKDCVQRFETDLIQESMEAARFNQRKAAELLGVTYHQLRGYLKKYDLLASQDDS
ncbi:MAG: phage shock protein operon transcriptional activator, partial [Gammaproteobacteria bacterium]|nr:phage shock protein operon transcriptional activator [Gammaproteobacteria bacterium]